ncbi:GntR family transcriptional regulator [Streptacidiphilus sp. PAMC 29251]
MKDVVMSDPQLGMIEPLDRPESLSDRAYAALREKIAAGALEPGQKLTERALAVLLGVSPTPVREALRRLEQEGLVERPTPRSLMVTAHSETVLRELLYTEVVLRAASARFAAQKVTDADIAALEAIVEELAVRADTGSAEEVLEIATRFDARLAQVAANRAVAGLVEMAGVLGHARRVRAVTAMQTSARDVGARHLQAHRDTVEALRAQDEERTEQIVRKHLLSSLELLLSTDGETS